jgi:hypothetical protein
MILLRTPRANPQRMAGCKDLWKPLQLGRATERDGYATRPQVTTPRLRIRPGAYRRARRKVAPYKRHAKDNSALRANRLPLRHSRVLSQPKITPAQPTCLAPIQRCLMKAPVCSSAIAWRSCSSVFITIGPYHATGSSIGLPETSRKRIPSSAAWTRISSPRSNSTSE